MTTVRADLKIQAVDIDLVKPYEKNAKLHRPEQIAKLAEAISKFGWDQPIVVDKDYVIIKGHGRRLAAIKLGLKKVFVLVRDDLSPAEVNAARLSDNRVASTEYDTRLLQDELRDLQAELGDLSSLGFDEKELDFLTAELDQMDGNAFIDDITTAVETQDTANAEKVAEIDEKARPIGDALGFKTVTPEQFRRVNAFMIQCEADTGQKGAEALLTFLDELGVAA